MAGDDQRLAEIMTDNIISLEPDETLRDAIEMFERYTFRAIPVVNEDDHLLGVVSFGSIKGLKPRLA